MTTDPRMLAMTARAVPQLPADAHVAINSQGLDLQQTMDSAQGTQAFADATSQVNYMKERSQDEQISMWQNAPDAQRAQWVGAGYSPPGDNHSRDMFKRAAYDVLGAPSAAYRQIQKVPVLGDAVTDVGHIGGAVMTAAGAGGRAVQHAYRTGEMFNVDQQNHDDVASNVLAAIGGAAMDPGAWADAWHETTRGDQTFNPVKDRDIQAGSGLNGDEIGLAKAAAGSRKDVQNYLQMKQNSGSDTQTLTKLTARMQDADFQDVVQQYKDAKLSFGRSLVPSYLWSHDHQLAEALSGVGDAAFSFVDPLIIGGKINKVARVSKYAFGSLEEFETKLASSGFQKYAEDVARYTAAGDAPGLARAHPELNDVNAWLTQRKPQTAEEFTQLAKGDKEGRDAAKAGINALESQKAEAQRALDEAQLAHAAVTQDGAQGFSMTSRQSKKAVREAQYNLDITTRKTEAAVKDFMTNNALTLHLAGGGGLTISGAPALPSFTAAGRVALATKMAGRDAIDWMKEYKIDAGENGMLNALGQVVTKPVNVVGELLKKATTLAPVHGPIDLNDPKSFTRVEQFLNIALPRETSDRLLQMWADAPDEGQRKTIWNMIGEQVLKSAGVPETNDLYKRFSVDTASGLADRRYSVNGNDLVDNGNGTQQPAGLLFKQANSLAYMPAFRDIYANAQRGLAMRAAYGLFNNPFMDWAMTRWKKFSLARPGFGVRITEEETANAALRDGLLNLVKAQLAHRVTAAAGETATHGPFYDLNPIEHGASVLARELGDRDLVGDETLEDLQHKVFANRTSKFFSFLGQKVPGVNDLVDTQRKFPELFQNPLAEEINAQHGMGRNYASNMQDDIETMQDGIAKHVWNPTPKVNVKPTGKWIPYFSGSPGHTGMWMARLDDIAGDAATRPVLENLGLPDNELRRIVANNLLDEQNSEYWKRMTRGWKTADGRVLDEHATKDDLALDWADHLITHVKSFVYSHTDGQPAEPIEGFVDHMLKTRTAPSMEDLLKVETEKRPPVTIGPEFAELPFGGVNGVLSEFADGLLSRMGGAVNVFSRHAQYLQGVHDADKSLAPIVGSILGDGPAAQEVLQTLVHENAVRKVSQFVHRPEVRSQLNVILTNLLPFQFAQEQFWKRWGKTFIHDPAAFRKAQLAHHALGATGIVHKDDQGNEIFSYPATGFVQKELVNAFDFMGIPAKLPIRQAFTGQLKMVAPGLDRTAAPSFGPLVSIPMNAVTRRFPELQPTTTKVLGDISTGRPYWEQVLPASLSRFVNAFTASQNNSQSYANAMMKATQDLAATNNLPVGGFDDKGNPLPMTADERERLMRRVSNWTRIQFLVRAGLGLGAPASPELTIGDTKIGQEIRMLSSVKGLNLSEALQEVVRQNPDAYPYEVFLSQGAGSETLPATKEALESLNKHADFYTANKTAGGYFLPSTSADDKFSDEAYKEQLAYGLREHRSVDQFVDQLQYAQAASDYYDTKDDYTKAVKNLSGQAKKQATEAWSAWRSQYLTNHPVFADKLGAATAVIERHRTLTDLRKALDDPRAPQGQQTEEIRDLIETYDDYTKTQGQYANMQTNVANNAKKSNQQAFWTWAVGDNNNGWISKHPGALDVFNRLIRPEVEPQT